jgi:hypothetical protein
MLYQTYCRSTLTHGLENLSLNSKEIDELKKHEAKIIKASLKVGKRSSNSKVLRIIGMDHIDEVIKKRKLSFFLRLIQNKCRVVQT